MKKINPIFLQNFLTLRYDPSNYSLMNLASYRDFLPTNSDNNGKISEQLLEQSIRTKIPDNDKPIAISLSAGIDSTLCLALTRKIFPGRKITALCGVFGENYEESKIAKQISEQFNADFKIVHMQSTFENMSKIISITKKPRWNTYNHLIAEEAKKFSSILITGDGADEIFSGYTFRYKKFLGNLSSNDNWLNKTKKYLECHNRDWVPDQEYIFNKKINFNWSNIYTIFKKYFQNSLEPINQLMLADFNGKLMFDFIPTSHSIYKHYKIKGVPIFLDSKIISFARHIPINEKYDLQQNKGKLILRKITKRLKIKHIDEKKGFSPDLILDWQINGKQICETFLLDKKSHIYTNKIINFDWINRIFEKIENDGDIRYLNKAISILAVEIWFRLQTKELKSTEKLI